MMENNYHNSLLYLTHSVIRSDGVIQTVESDALNTLREHEGISIDEQNGFLKDVENMEANQIYHKALDTLKQCNREEQKKVLAWVYSLSTVDNSVDVKEARFMLYAINSTNIGLEEIMDEAKLLPGLP